jgi:bifunctional non-homologous end joining protein LigD
LFCLLFIAVSRCCKKAAGPSKFALRTDKKPFDQKVKNVNTITWLIPKLVGEIKFTEWTSEGEMRHPVFLGLRSDKAAADVLRE